jgi:flagellar M-ring protein FliF
MPSPLAQIKEIWNRLPMGGRIATVGAAVATAVLLGAIVYYGSQPDYGVLFSDLKAEDAQTIVEKLKAANVPYELANNGTTIQVPHERISELRLQMASEGALSGGHVGFDLFDKTNFGATDFAQQINYRRAIEGELAKTLEGMDEVDSARVHITPKKESVFTEKEESAKASVMLRVKQNKELSSERTDAIVSLLASSVEGLDSSNVSVMDTRGRLLSAGRGKSGAISDAGVFQSQLEAKQKYEAETAARVIALLEPVVGENKVKADIAADVDFSQVEQTEEKYDPQSQVVRSQQTTSEQRNQAVPANGGVVGARSNDPTTQVAPTPAPNPAGNNDQRSNQTTNYEISKTTRRTIGGGGRVNRMSVSVVVDYKNVNGVDAVRSPDEIKQIQDLVAAAVGTDANRGDSVVVQTMAFNKPPDEAAAAGTWIENNKQLVASALKYGSLVLVALLVLFFVVRPARKALRAAAARPELVEAEQKLLAAASEEAILERRELEKEKTNAEIDGKPANQSMMTVAELQARLDGGLDRADEPLNPEFVRADSIKKELIAESMQNTEMVVSTLRGWLRES